MGLSNLRGFLKGVPKGIYKVSIRGLGLLIGAWGLAARIISKVTILRHTYNPR